MNMKKISVIILSAILVFLAINTVSAGDPQQITVWEDYRDGGESHIYYKNIETGQTGRVTGINSEQYRPAISGNTIVWEDYRDNAEECHIYS